MLTLLIRRKKYVLITVFICAAYIVLIRGAWRLSDLDKDSEYQRMAHDGHHDHHAMHSPIEHDHVVTQAPSFAAVTDEVVAQHVHAGEGHSHGGHGMSSMMHMAFHFGYNELVLFPFWKVETILGLLLSCLVIFALAVLYEGLKILRCEVTCRCARKRYQQQRLGPKYPHSAPSSHTHGNVTVNSGGGNSDQFKRAGTNGEHLLREAGRSAEEDIVGSHFTRMDNAETYRMYCCSSVHMVQTLLHVVQVFVGFLLMLIFMTYNVWLCLAVLLGAGVGYYCFAWRVRALTDMLDDSTNGATPPSHMAVNVQNEQICQDCH